MDALPLDEAAIETSLSTVDVAWYNKIFMIECEMAELPFEERAIKQQNQMKSALFHFPKGAEASAIIYSVAATACANGLNVEEYLTNIFKSHGNELTLPR